MPRDADGLIINSDGSHNIKGFTVKCACGSERFIIDSDVGYSDTSGGWGGIRLKCLECHFEAEIWEMFD